MKTILKTTFLFSFLLFSIVTFSQFEQGGKIISGNGSLNYDKYDELNQITLNAFFGQFISDNIAIGLELQDMFQSGYGSSVNVLEAGVVGRYYIQNLYPEAAFGIGLASSDGNSSNGTYYRLGLGYAIMASDNISVDPKLYFRNNMSDGSSQSQFGFMMGFNLYF